MRTRLHGLRGVVGLALLAPLLLVGSLAMLPLSATSSEAASKISLDEFIVKINGSKNYDADGKWPGECVDVWRAYNKLVVKNSVDTGTPGNGAESLWTGFEKWSGRSAYTKVDKGETPRRGDVAVWGATPDNPYGHVAIVLESTSSGLRLLEQNYKGERVVKVRAKSSKSGIIGYLRPKSLDKGDMNLSGVSMKNACKDQYKNSGLTPKVLDSRNAYSWRCISKDGKTKRSIDVTKECARTHGPGVVSRLRNSRDPYSWYCYA